MAASTRTKKIDRRTLLRGLCAGGGLVGVGLPALEIMLNTHGTAYAAGPAFPKRFGVWYLGCGLTGKSAEAAVDAFFPKAPGPNWEPPRLMMPLVPFRDDITIVGGTNWTIAENTPHHTSRTSPLSGSYNLGNVGNGGKKGPAFDSLGPSIDRIVADAWKGQTRLDSIEVGVSRVGKYAGMISFKAGQIFPNEFDPKNVFNRLFGSGVPAGGAAPAPNVDLKAVLKARKSVLDAVMADARALKGALGKTDADRVEAHLGGLREIETQIGKLEAQGALPAGAGCALPAPPNPGVNDPLKEDLEGVHKVMADLLVTALACDITRVFSLEFTSAQAQTVFWQVNFLKPIHDNTHQAASPDADMLNAAEFSLKQLAYLLGRLKATPQGAGNLLDSMALYHVNEYLVGAPHTMKNGNHPIVLAGKAGGALRTGQFVRPPAVENGSRVCLALLHALGIMAPSFGLEKGLATEALPGLLA